MRKLILFMNVSLDGYFEAPGHDISGFKPDFEIFSAQKSQAVDALLFGHRTYEMMKFWSTPQGVEMAPEMAHFITAAPKFVASRQPFEPGWHNVRVLNGDVPAAVRQIKQQPGGSIMMFGSNMLCVALMQAGLMDEFQIVLNPLALGAGTPLFAGLAGKADLTLQTLRRFNSGNVLLTYQPAPA